AADRSRLFFAGRAFDLDVFHDRFRVAGFVAATVQHPDAHGVGLRAREGVEDAPLVFPFFGHLCAVFLVAEVPFVDRGDERLAFGDQAVFVGEFLFFFGERLVLGDDFLVDFDRRLTFFVTFFLAFGGGGAFFVGLQRRFVGRYLGGDPFAFVDQYSYGFFEFFLLGFSD